MFTRMIYPLSLRERVSWRARKIFPKAKDRDVSLEFDKNLKMDLSNTDVGHQSIIFNGFYELDLTKKMVASPKRAGYYLMLAPITATTLVCGPLRIKRIGFMLLRLRP